MKIPVHGFHLRERISLDEVRKVIGYPLVKEDSTFLLYHMEETFVYVKDYGGIVFVNVPEEDTRSMLVRIGVTDDWFEETLDLEVNSQKAITVNYDLICIPELDIDMVHIICLNIAQSLALSHYQNEVDQLLQRTRLITNRLQQTGRVSVTRRKLAMFIAEIMSLRNRLADNLYIFESPPFAWNDKKLTELDELINAEFDFSNRHKSIQHSINVTKDNHEFFNDLLQHKHSSLLEWIIIILILFEVVHLLIN